MNKEKVLPMGIRGKIHSSLEHAISLLEAERATIQAWLDSVLGSTGDDTTFEENQLAGITKAISILNAEKIKDIDLAEKKF